MSDEAPDLTHHVLGWKELLVSDNGYLRSVTDCYVYEPGVVARAVCSNGRLGVGRDHPAPDPDCGCGLYAHHSPDYLSPARHPTVVAVVRGWGRVAVHPTGFRSEFMEICALVGIEGMTGFEEACLRYGIPGYPAPTTEAAAVTYHKARCEADAFPVPEELRPLLPEPPEHAPAPPTYKAPPSFPPSLLAAMRREQKRDRRWYRRYARNVVGYSGPYNWYERGILAIGSISIAAMFFLPALLVLFWVGVL